MVRRRRGLRRTRPRGKTTSLATRCTRRTADRTNASTFKPARTAFYKLRIPAVVDLLERYSSPTAQDLTDLLSQRYFEPQRDWLLFEVAIALRLARAFAKVSATKRRSRLLVGTGRKAHTPVTACRTAPKCDSGTRRGPQTRARRRTRTHADATRIAAGPPRPDFIAQRRIQGASTDAVLLEVKASRDARYLGAGLLQLLGISVTDRRCSRRRRAAGLWRLPLLRSIPLPLTAPHCGQWTAPRSPRHWSRGSAIRASDARRALVAPSARAFAGSSHSGVIRDAVLPLKSGR